MSPVFVLHAVAGRGMSGLETGEQCGSNTAHAPRQAARIEQRCADAPAAARRRRQRKRRHSLTLADGALDVAHDEAVLIVQELDAHLGDLLVGDVRRRKEEVRRLCVLRTAPSASLSATQPSIACPPLTWPREPVRPMTFITMASLAG